MFNNKLDKVIKPNHSKERIMTTKDRNVQNRNYLEQHEVNRLLVYASKTRQSLRDKLIILLLYRHGLRVSELTSLKLDSIDLKTGRIRIKRLKGSNDSNQPLQGDVIRLLRKYLRERKHESNYLILSNRGQPIARNTVTQLINDLSIKANLPIKASAHTLRHSCGYYLANIGTPIEVIQDYLGHKNINNTRIYTRLSSHKFNNLWD